jgi:CheY-like chemotaxis protein
MTIAKILIVDDDEDIRMVSEVVARRIGQWEVVLAASGEEALERASEEQPDVILLDVMMPGMDGPATLEQLRRDSATAAIPVIFLTARAQSHEIERYLALGADGVIVKPFEAMTLPDRIRQIVEAG